MKDLMNNISVRVALAPLAAAITGDTPQVCSIIDRLGYESLTYVIATGALADAGATFAVTMHEGNDPALTDAAPVAAKDLIGTLALAGFTEASDGTTRKVAYIGNKRHTRLTITPTGNAAAAPLAVLAVLGHPYSAPTPNP
jgi:hypothetical protein